MAGRGRTGHCCRASCELSFSRVVGAMYAIVCSTVLAPCLAHIDVRVSKVDLEARMSSVRGMHCNGCASTATASTAMSSLSVECARPALRWMCASIAMSSGYTALSTAIMTIVGEHIDVRVPKVDLFECARRALQWMRVHRDCIHCNVTSICPVRIIHTSAVY